MNREVEVSISGLVEQFNAVCLGSTLYSVTPRGPYLVALEVMPHLT